MYLCNMDKFLYKNKESFVKMDAYIEMNRDVIRRIITSVELFHYIMNANNIIDDMDMGYIKYKGITMVKDIYYPANKVGFILKNQEIEFDVPCICCYYKGEGHNLK